MPDPLDALGAIGSVLGIISFIRTNVPDRPKVGAAVRVKLGLGEKGNTHAIEGDIGGVYAWDTNHEYRGKSDGAYIKAGDIHDFKVAQDTGGARAEYIGVSAGKDAVCIAWITVHMHDSTEGGAWTGDIGYNCDQKWYPQSEKAGSLPDGGGDYIPHCTWLDEDHTDDVASAALKFKTTAYAEKVKDTLKNAQACQYTLWGPDNGPINAKPGRRALKPRQAWMEDRLVLSNITQHSTKELCSSASSWGPDFVGPDGFFCDMGIKMLAPLCSLQAVEGCVDIGDDGRTLTKRKSIAKRVVNAHHKSYGTVTHWK
ncbi:hypothetical protein MY5147_001542 [Beauveria neobassiana]